MKNNAILKKVVFDDGSVEWVPVKGDLFSLKTSLLERLFKVVSRKKLVTQAMSIYLNEDTGRAYGKTEDARAKDFYYRAGNASALNGLCSALGIDLTKCIKEEVEKHERA